MAGRITKDPNTGQWIEIIGNQIRPLSGPNPDQIKEAQQYAEQAGGGEAFGMGLANAIGAGHWGGMAGIDTDQYQADMSALAQKYPWLYGGAHAAAAVPAAIATGGSSIPTQMAAGGVLGALANAQNPIEGALLEGGAAGIGGAIGKGISRFMGSGTTMSDRVASTVNKVKGAVDDISFPGYEPGMMAVAPGRAGKGALQKRVAAQAAARAAGETVDDGSGLMLQGYMNPAELAEIGIDTTQGDMMALGARSADELSQANFARAGEELRRTDTLGLGRGIEEVRESQKMGGTNFIKNVLGIEGEQTLTREVVADTFQKMGQEFDYFAQQMGDVPISDQVMAGLDDLVENAPSNYANQLGKLRDDVAKIVEKNQGTMPANKWQGIRTRLGKMIDAGGRQGDHGKINDAAQFQEALSDSMEQSLGADQREHLKNLRRRYAVAKTVNKGATLDPSGVINPTTFYNNWRKGGGLKNVDDITRAFETLRYLTSKTLPSSGTMERMIANPGRVAVEAGKASIPTGVLGAGIMALND